VVRNPGLPTEHQEVNGFTSTDVWGAAVSPHDLREHCIPFLLTAAKEQAPERITQHVVVRLYNPVTLWMVRGSLTLIHPPPEATKVAHQLRLELSTLVRVYLFRKTKVTEHMLVRHAGPQSEPTRLGQPEHWLT